MNQLAKSIFTNWKTTAAGAVGAVGTYLATQPGGWAVIGQVLQALGVFLLGVASKDSNVTGGTTPQA